MFRKKPQFFDINKDNFSSYLKVPKDDSFQLTLEQGQWCYVNPGIQFEILSFDTTCHTPGYVTPLDKGVFGIFSETGKTTIELKRAIVPNLCFGVGLKGKASYGPSYDTDNKGLEVTAIIYFDKGGEFVSDSGSANQKEPGAHVLMICTSKNTLMIIDAQKNAYKAFKRGAHWQDIYKDKVTIKMLADEVNYQFAPLLAQSQKEIDLSQSIPDGAKVSKFICYNKLGEDNIGIKMKLSGSGTCVEIPFENPQHDTMLFQFAAATFLMIPEAPQGLLQIYRPEDLLSPGASVVGREETIVEVKYNYFGPY